MGEMKYIKLFYDKVELCRQMGLSNEEFGCLIYAVVEYCQTGTRNENIPDRIKYPYFDMISGADRAKTDYEKKCAINAANGAKGGKTKAENAKKAAGEEVQNLPKWKPPTQKTFIKDFQKLANELYVDYDVEYEPTETEIKIIFNKFSDDNWSVEGIPITTDEEYLYVLGIYVDDKGFNCNNWLLFRYAVKKIGSILEYMKNDFIQLIDYWDDEKRILIIDSAEYKIHQINEALDYLCDKYANK